MIEYIEWKKSELEAQLRTRTLPHSGSKAVLAKRLQDNDIFPTLASPYQTREDPVPLPEDFLEQMKNSDPRPIIKLLRKLVHDRNLRKKRKQMQIQSYGRKRPSYQLFYDHDDLNSGQCLEVTCPLCGGFKYMSLDLNDDLGTVARCTDGTCKDYNNCYMCRKELLKLEDVYVERREEESCVDGSCGDLSKCLRCENHFRDYEVPIYRPNGVPGPLRRKWSPHDITQLRKALTDMGLVIHNEYLNRLFKQLQNKVPDTDEWVKIQQKLKDGKCLGSDCSSCGTASLTKSLEALSTGIRTNCGEDRHLNASDIITCSSCRQTLHHMVDALSGMEKGACISGRCGDCVKCRRQAGSGFTPSSVVHPRDKPGVFQKVYGVSSLCLDDENCTGIETCGACQWEKFMDKEKRAERSRDDIRARRFERLGQCDGADPDLPYGLGCRYLDCNRCRLIEANMGPKERNDELRRRRVEDIKTSLDESSDGTMTGLSRKRRFSNLDLHFPLSRDHPLAKRVREEKHREKLERQKAQSQHERPSWFGTPEDPLPDRWMGRPILSKEDIDILKVRHSIPKYYLSESEDYNVGLATGAETKKFSAIIRRLEAELMSRDFWMQSLGYDADDGFGNFPAGDYALEDTQCTSTEGSDSGQVENWLSTVKRP
jgi:hypothetical protein